MLLQLLLWSSFPLLSFAQYLPNAGVAWRRQLQGRMRRGNGMAFTKTGILVATTDNGALHILGRDNGPIRMHLPTDIIEGTLLCRSKPVLASPEMAIYSVSNHVLAVNLTDASTIWSAEVDEPLVGSPAVSRRGLSVYVTHNDGNTGSVTVIRLSTGQKLATLSGDVPFGPPTVVFRTNTASDAVFFGDATDNGFSANLANLYALLWDAREHSRRNGEGERSYDLIVAATGLRSTSTAPAVANDLRLYLGAQGSLVFGFDHNEQSNLLNEQSPATPWTASLELDPTNALSRTFLQLIVPIFTHQVFAAIPTTPVFSSDNIFVAGAGNHITSIAITGNVAGWDDRSIGSPIYSQPIFFNDRTVPFPVLYFVEREGIVYQKDARFGTTNWSLDVEMPVEADLAMNDNGNLLYVGDTSGNVLAVRVAGYPTTAPTDAPTTMAPTLAPVVMEGNDPDVVDPEPNEPETNDPETDSPVVAPSPSNTESSPDDTTLAPQMSPQQQPTAASDVQNDDKSNQSSAKEEESFLVSNSYYLGGGGVLILLALLFVCLLCLRRRRRSKQQLTKSGDSTAVEERMDDLEQQAYEKECAENEQSTLMEIASSPNKSDQVRSMSSWESGTPHTLASIEESPEVDEGQKSGDDTSFGYEVAMDRSISEHHSTARSLDGLMSDVEDDVDKNDRNTYKGISSTLAESTEALAKAVGAAVAAISSPEEKKETESVSSREDVALRRVKSTETDFSTPTQPGRIRSEKNRPSSPSDMISVDSSSIYLDEPSIHSMDRVQSVAKNSAVEDALVGKAAPAPKECPEDEGRGILRPGSAYLSRHNEKKVVDPPVFNNVARTRSAPVSNGPDRLQPIYNGVSVRPAGRSRAGIFSRRQPQLSTFTDDEEEHEPSAKLPVKLGPKRSEILRSQKPKMGESEDGPRFTAHTYYEEPVEISNIVSADSEDYPEPVYTETSPKSSKRRGSQQQQASNDTANTTSMTDPWGSFLSELSKVESSFFSTSGLLAGRNGEDSGDDATADEDNSAPPPAPRTFYA